jgi:hypothetical protein
MHGGSVPRNTEVIARFRRTYDLLSSDSIWLLDDLYDESVVFIDPIHEIRGLPALREYMTRMYGGVKRCAFEHHSVLVSRREAMLTWTMEMEHKRFRPDRVLRLPGATVIRFGDKITYQRDYYDLGALIYERVPVLGPIVQWIKKRL